MRKHQHPKKDEQINLIWHKLVSSTTKIGTLSPKKTKQIKDFIERF